MMHSAVLIATMSIVTILIRFLPFIAFRKQIPGYISYLGKVLPPAIIALLVAGALRRRSRAGGRAVKREDAA